MRQIDTDIVAYLAANVSGLAIGINLYAHPLMPAEGTVPSKSVFVTCTGGFPDDPYKDGSRNAFCRSTVQVLVRGPVDDYGQAQELARLCRDHLYGASISGYTDVMVRESEPMAIGQEDSGAYLFALNLVLTHDRR